MTLVILIVSLSLSIACGAVYRVSGISAWRLYGRLGRAGAGLLLGALLLLAMILVEFLGATIGIGTTQSDVNDRWRQIAEASFILAPFLLAVLAFAKIDVLLAFAASLVLGVSLPFAFGPDALVLAPVPALLVLFGAWLTRLRASRTQWPIGLLPGLAAASFAMPVLFLPGTEAETNTALAVLPAFIPAYWMLLRLFDDRIDLTAGAGEDGIAPGRSAHATSPIGRAIADLPEGVAIFDAADRLVACNETYRRLNAPIVGELVPGAVYADLARAAVLHGPVQADPEAAITAGLAKHANLPWREEIVDEAGRSLLIIESRTQEGGSLRIMSDITAIKGREARLTALAERNSVLATAVASVNSGIVICDATRPGLPVTFVNAAFTRITGYQPTEILGASCRVLQGRDTDAHAIEHMRRAIARQKPVTVTLRNYRKDGRTFWNELSLSPISDETGRVTQFVGIVNDATQRIRAEENLKVAKEQAEAANRTKSDFLANVSHELRTPLNAIIGFSEVMRMEMFGALGAPQYRDYAKDVHDSGQHLLSLINDILDISKIEAGKMDLYPEPVAIEEIFDSCQRLMRERAAKAGLRLVIEAERALPPVFMDMRALKQIVTNLLSNAVKFTPEGGQVRLSARLVGEGPQRRAELVVADTGIGIAKEDIEKALLPFGQVDSPEQRRHAGTGLGLPIVKSLIDLSGGSFRLESELGRGTRIVLSIPLASPERTSRVA
jgi:PAS domain S-box-containing protein